MHLLLGILLFILFLVLIFAVTIGIAALVSAIPMLFQPAGTLFIVSNGMFVLIFVFEALFILLSLALLEKLGVMTFLPCSTIKKAITALKKFWYMFVLIVLLSLYLIVIDNTFVTADAIHVKRPLDPRGTTYAYTDVLGVETGYYTTRLERSPSFHYILLLPGGQHIDLMNTGVTFGDTDVYENVQEFDSRLMQYAVPKIADMSSLDHCDYNETVMAQIRSVMETTGR